MNAGEIVALLLKAGRGLSDAFREAKKADGNLTLGAFIKSDAAKEVVKKVEGLLAGLDTAKIEAAIKQSAAKRFAILNGRTVFDLSDQEAAQYDALVETEDKLFAKANGKLQKRDAFYTWLVEEGLGVLRQVATIVIPLL